MPTMPGRTEYPRRSRIVVPSLGGRSAPGEIAAILPSSMETFRSRLGGAPVPSMTSTCSRTTLGVLTLTYLRTSGPRVSTRWATAGPEHHKAARQRCRSRSVLIVMATPPFEQCKRAGIPSGALTSKRSRRAGALGRTTESAADDRAYLCRDASSCPRRPCRCAPPASHRGGAGDRRRAARGDEAEAVAQERLRPRLGGGGSLHRLRQMTASRRTLIVALGLALLGAAFTAMNAHLPILRNS